jgi:hypothetical protein
MKWGKTYYCVAFLAIVSLLIISGCVSKEPQGTPVPTAIPTAVPTQVVPTATPSPTQQPGISVEVLNAPENASAGKSFDIIWRVNSPSEKNITHTAIHYGPESKSEPLTLASYPILTTAKIGKIPANFSDKITINATGVTYFRAHAIVDGLNYWSSEKMISIKGSPTVIITATPTATQTSSGY